MDLTVSVIVCTYNGVARIEKCIDAVLNVDFSTKIEIIVVDDGSTDNTLNVLSDKPVKVIKHDFNKGRAAARNTGLKNAKGNIVAYIDDDCIPHTNWLLELVSPYADKSVIAVGGLTIPYRLETLSQKYLYATGYGNPAVLEFGRSNSVIHRLFVYMKNMLFPVSESSLEVFPVLEVYTGNCSYRKDVLIKVKGFDETLHFNEDTDISRRLRDEYKDSKIVFAKKAVVENDYVSSVLKLIEQSFLRSKSVLIYYKIQSKIPPIFPFPLLCLLISAILLLSGYSYFIGFVPVFVYYWWALRFAKKKEMYYLAYPYIQFMIELSTLVGFSYYAGKDYLYSYLHIGHKN